MLVIYAHFDRSGHNGEVLRTVEECLGTRKIPYEVLDLYASGFDPILRAEDVKARGKSAHDATVRALQEKIESERDFVFIYPTWWTNVPAMLKGFYDRVFSAGFAFRYGANGLPVRLLRGRRALVITTTGGPAAYHRIVTLGRSLRVSTDDVLGFSGFRTRSLLIGNCRGIDEAKRGEIRRRVRRVMDRFVG